jgi:hypothetical protein
LPPRSWASKRKMTKSDMPSTFFSLLCIHGGVWKTFSLNYVRADSLEGWVESFIASNVNKSISSYFLYILRYKQWRIISLFNMRILWILNRKKISVIFGQVLHFRFYLKIRQVL